MIMIQNLADQVAELRDRRDNFKAQFDETKAELEVAEKELVDLMVAEDMPKFTRNGRTFYLSMKLLASILPDKKAECYEWLKENGYGTLVIETVMAQTLTAFVKELRGDDDAPLPVGLEEFLKVYEESKLNIRKGK